MFGTGYRARCCSRFHHLPPQVTGGLHTRHTPPLQFTQQQITMGNVVRCIIPTEVSCERHKMENYNSHNDQQFRNVWIAAFATTTKKLQLYKVLYENNKDAKQNCQYTATFIVLCCQYFSLSETVIHVTYSSDLSTPVIKPIHSLTS